MAGDGWVGGSGRQTGRGKWLSSPSVVEGEVTLVLEGSPGEVPTNWPSAGSGAVERCLVDDASGGRSVWQRAPEGFLV